MYHLKIYSGAVLMLLFSTTLSAQVSPKRVLGTFISKQNVYNYEFNMESIQNYTFTLSSFTDQGKRDSVKKDSVTKTVKTDAAVKDTTKTAKASNDSTTVGKPLNYIFSDFEQNVFEDLFMIQMKNKFKRTDTTELKKKATQIFFEIKAKLEFLDDEPITANLILRRDEITSVLKGEVPADYTGRLHDLLVIHRIDKVSVETEDGAIKNIFVKLIEPGILNTNAQSPRRYLEFRNAYPISISSKNDPERFSNVYLYSFNCGGVRGLTRYIKLSDLLLLDIVLENDKEDYSPSNRVVKLSPSLPIVELRKEKRSRILEIAAYSDFVGLDQEQPNGLIQIEAKRKINVNTKFRPFFGINKNENISAQHNLDIVDITKINNKYTTEKQKRTSDTTVKTSSGKASPGKVNSASWDNIAIENANFRAPYYNIFGSIEPRLLFSKLEENNKYLLLDSTNFSNKKVNSLNLYQYQTSSLGFTLNTFRVVFPQSKVNWTVVDLGLFWYRTRAKALSDTASKNSTPLNSSYWSVSTSVNFRPDSRWGASLSAAYIKQNLWNENFKILRNSGIFQAGIDGHLKTNDNAKLFFRFRWLFDGHTFNNNFTQIQLGYSLNIFTNKEEKQ